MAKVTNKHDGPLLVADVEVRPGATVEVEDEALRDWSNGQTARRWLKLGMIETDSKLVTEDGSTSRETTAQRERREAKNAAANDAATERETLFADARALGLNPNGNTSTAKLTEMVAAEREKQAAGGPDAGEAPRGDTGGTHTGGDAT